MYWCVYIGTAMVVLILNYLKSAHSIFSRLQTCRRIDARFQLLQKGCENMKKHENYFFTKRDILYGQNEEKWRN